MSDLNSFCFTGRVTRDALLKQVNNKSLMEVSVANNIGFGDYAKTNWLKVKMWGERVNNVCHLFTKGSLVAGQGELALSEWTDKDGVKWVDMVVTVMNLQLLSKPKDKTEEPVEDVVF